MGVWSLGSYGLQHDRTDPGLLSSYAKVLPGYSQDDIIGSPFAITQFVCNPSIGSDNDLSNFRARLRQRGISLFLDFVPNHTAVDAGLEKEIYIHAPSSVAPPYDPSWYLPSGIAYGRDPYSGAWTDTAQLNYWNPNARALMAKALARVAALADGCRVDMAMLVLNDIMQQTWGDILQKCGYTRPSTEFWPDAIAAAKAVNPSFKVMGEVYWDGMPARLHSLGFDWLYDKDGLYNLEVDGNLDNLRSYIRSQDFSWMVHFVENHDEDRAVTKFGSDARADAAALTSMTLPGMRFYFQGQLVGRGNKLDVHLRRSAAESVRADVQSFYVLLLNITSSPVFHQGIWHDLTVSDTVGTAWRLMAWSWSFGDEKRLVVVNYSDQQGQGRVQVPDATPKQGQDVIPITDLMTSQTYLRSSAEMRSPGLYVVINPWTAQVFTY